MAIQLVVWYAYDASIAMGLVRWAVRRDDYVVCAQTSIVRGDELAAAAIGLSSGIYQLLKTALLVGGTSCGWFPDRVWTSVRILD
jgi:hypothetical protein